MPRLEIKEKWVSLQKIVFGDGREAYLAFREKPIEDKCVSYLEAKPILRKIEALERSQEDLSALVRLLARYARNRKPDEACAKILEAFDRCQHLLTQRTVLRTFDEKSKF